MTLAVILLFSFLYFFHLYRSGSSRIQSFILGILVGLAVLAKGPLGVVLPCFAFLWFLWLRGDLAFVKKSHPFIFIITCAAVAGSWYVLALLQAGRGFLDVVVKENFSMAMGAEAGHPHPFFSYMPFFFQNAAPWSLFSIPIGAWLYRSRREPGQEELLYFVVWFSTVFVFFSAFTQKRPVYILPLYPAFAILLGAWCQKLKEGHSLIGHAAAKAAAYLVAVAFFLFSGMLLLQLANGEFVKFLSSHLSPKDHD